LWREVVVVEKLSAVVAAVEDLFITRPLLVPMVLIWLQLGAVELEDGDLAILRG
jgi:hypothetical protein